MRKQFIIQANVSEDLKAQFEELFNDSGANSRGEFFNWLIDRYINPETITKKVEVVKEVPVEKEVIKEIPVEKEIEVIREVEKEVPISLTENQLLIDLNPAQLALLKEICNEKNTIKKQNAYALNEKFIKKFGDILNVLEEGNEMHNVNATLVNIVILQAIEGPWDWTETLSKKQIRKIIDTANGIEPEEEKGFWD